MKNLALPYLPDQNSGEETETSYAVEATYPETAKLLFEQACEKLNAINNWSKLCGALSAEFVLTDDRGSIVTGSPKENQYIRIDIPGPGTQSGRGYDWVIIEAIKHEIISPTQQLYIIQARPSAMPGADINSTAHFLTAKATSSFAIVLSGNTVSATVFGRNEIPNVSNQNLGDKIRNAVVGASGAIGISKLQWKALVKGILSK